MVFAYRHALLQAQPKASKRVPPRLPKLPHLFTATIRRGIGKSIERLPLDVGVHPLERRFEVAAIDASTASRTVSTFSSDIADPD